MNPFASLGRNGIAVAALIVVALLVLFSTVAIVPETKQALIVRLGRPLPGVYNAYRSNQDYGHTGAGLLFRIPFVDTIEWVDKRVLDFDMDRQSVLSTDQLRLEVDAYARYRIVDPLQMFITARTERRVGEALRPILGSSLRNELGRRRFSALLSPERGQLMDNIQQRLNRVARQYGAEIVDVRIKRADLPDGTPLTSAFERMRTARQQEALTLRAQGMREAQVTRADADADAARVYADAFNKDPAFYDFYRAMQSYRTTFGTDDANPRGGSNVILSPDNEYLKQFKGQR